MTNGNSYLELYRLCVTADEFRNDIPQDNRKAYAMGILDQMYAAGTLTIDSYNELIDELERYTFKQTRVMEAT
jgi:uncharacterized membrane protein